MPHHSSTLREVGGVLWRVQEKVWSERRRGGGAACPNREKREKEKESPVSECVEPDREL